jgi:hypothetical protein
VTVDAVDRKKADAAGHDCRLDSFDEKESLVLEIVSRCSWKKKYGPSACSVRHNRHFEAKPRTSPSIETTRQAVVYKLQAGILA